MNKFLVYRNWNYRVKYFKLHKMHFNSVRCKVIQEYLQFGRLVQKVLVQRIFGLSSQTWGDQGKIQSFLTSNKASQHLSIVISSLTVQGLQISVEATFPFLICFSFPVSKRQWKWIWNEWKWKYVFFFIELSLSVYIYRYICIYLYIQWVIINSHI